MNDYNKYLISSMMQMVRGRQRKFVMHVAIAF